MLRIPVAEIVEA